MKFAYIKNTLKISAVSAVGIAATFGLAPVKDAFADTTSLATQIANDSTLASSIYGQLLAGPTISTLQSLSAEQWNEVMFGTTTPTAAQQNTASHLGLSLEQLLTLQASTQTAAQTLITNLVTNMQALNPSITSTDATGFIQLVVNGARTELSALQSIQNPSTDNFATQLHTAFFNDLTTYDNTEITSLFSPNGPTSVATTGGSGVANVGTTTPPTSTGNAFTTSIAQASVDTGEKTISKSYSGTTFSIDVPAGAFSSTNQIALTGGVAQDVDNLLAKSTYKADKPAVTFGISFQNGVPTAPITVTIQNAAIESGAQVLKVGADGSLTPVQATIKTGQAKIQVSTDPYFIIANVATTTSKSSTPPTLTGNQKAIELNGKYVNVVQGIVRNKTMYMPLWYVMHALNQSGFTNTWNGNSHVWSMTAPKGTQLDYSNLQIGSGTAIYLDGKLIEKIPSFAATDPSSGKPTTYMPIWYVMQALKRAHAVTNWDGKTWTINTTQSVATSSNG